MAGVIKQLICPECGQMMATAVWRIFGGLRITTPDGFLLSPVNRAAACEAAANTS